MLSYRRPAACPPERREDVQDGAQPQRELSEPQTGDQRPPAGGGGGGVVYAEDGDKLPPARPQVGVQGAWSTQRTEQ